MATATKTAREIIVLNRYAWKDGSRVCFRIRSIKGTESTEDTTCLFSDGRATCTCDRFTKGHKTSCCHTDELRTREDARQSSLDDAEFAEWKKEHGLDLPMTSEEIENIARYELAYVA